MKVEDIRSRSALARILLSKVDPNGKKYGIVQIKYDNPATLDGTIVKVENRENGEQTTVGFKKFTLVVEGELEPYANTMRNEYIKALRINSPQFRKADDEFKAALDASLAEAKEEALNEFYGNGFYKGTGESGQKLASVNMIKKSLQESGHGVFLPPISYNQKRRLIVGGIYYADLNPAMLSEMGGVRPVIILHANRYLTTAICVPLTTQVWGGKDEITINDIKNGKMGRVCIDCIKTIDECRIRQKVGQVSTRILEAITKKIIKMLPQFEDEFGLPLQPWDIGQLEEISKKSDDDDIKQIMAGDPLPTEKAPVRAKKGVARYNRIAANVKNKANQQKKSKSVKHGGSQKDSPAQQEENDPIVSSQNTDDEQE